MIKIPIFEDDKIEPVAKIGENIIFTPLNSYAYKSGRPLFYKIAYIEPIPAVFKDFGTVSASSSITNQEVTDLYMDDNQLAQYRVIPIDDIEVAINQPQAMARFTTKSYTSYVSKLTDPHSFLEFFVFEDNNKPYFKITNPHDWDIAKSRVKFIGWKYILVPKLVKTENDIPNAFTAIPLEVQREAPEDPIDFFKRKVRGG